MKKFFVILVLVLAANAALAGDHYLAKLSLVDQNGRRVDLYDDLIKNHTVVLNSFFASCTGSCPVMARTFLHLQNKLGDRVGKDVILVSITVDPENDTPEKLKAYAEKMGAKRGWYFLSGSREEVDAALGKLGQYAEIREAHKNIIIAGNDRTGLWKKALAIAPSDEVWKVVSSVADDPGVAAKDGSAAKSAPAAVSGNR
jgi:protein SCO1/2